ncbi:VWA domain-containing protein, partial [Dissulfurirhabdus thermomarina]|nr:VWA domain-containing protein [Dissulfurirhabdus thermomarina]
ARWLLEGTEGPPPAPSGDTLPRLRRLLEPWAGALDTARAALHLARFTNPGDIEAAKALLPYAGAFHPGAVARGLLKRREEVRERLVELLAAVVAARPAGRRRGAAEAEERHQGRPRTEGDSGVALLVPPGRGRGPDAPLLDPAECLRLGGDAPVEGLEELRALIEEAAADHGGIPAAYVAAAQALASGAYHPGVTGAAEEAPPAAPAASRPVFTYPEWDFRRRGYRRDWCTVSEMPPPEAGGDFIRRTLERYRGQRLELRRRFEMLRTVDRLRTRQAEGDEVDIDALVEARADLLASGTAAEHLYVRRQRDRRDIAVAFLVDMSASTEGWVNRAIRESLVLLCEALTVLRDPFAVYGFSGMRRTGCHFFRIKDFGAPYDGEVGRRITGINARDYTRMGPAIRHATRLFREVDSRLRVLLTLSDGKPEDYDEYKGPYAIEDTRKALIEAKEQGVKPFCITIDREGRDYLPHMYGEVNYVVVPEVNLLHRRIPEIYRLLTT